MIHSKLTLGLAALGLLATAPEASAQAELTRTGGVLGSTMSYTIEGGPFELFAFLPSTTTGPTPLAILDPADPRLLGVGLDTDRGKRLGNIVGSGGLVPAEDEHEVCGHVLHPECWEKYGEI